MLFKDDQEYWEFLKENDPQAALDDLWNIYHQVILEIYELTGVGICAWPVQGMGNDGHLPNTKENKE